MGNALDYVNWRGDLSIARDPLNEVDLLLFAMLSTPDYEDIIKPEAEIRLSELSDAYFKRHPNASRSDLGALQSDLVLPTLKLMGSSARFKNITMLGAFKRINERKVEQFEAVSMKLRKDLIVISYRGTDDTLVGWKENCNLAIDNQVPSQKDALQYLKTMAETYPDAKFITVGHSKGGNLAIYAAVKAPKEVQERIFLAYGFDSPGFMDAFFETEGYKRMKDRIVTVLSQHSIVGALMKPAGKYRLIHSNVSGLMAHDCYNWEVMGPSFVGEESLGDFSLAFSRALYDTLKSLSKVQKIVFIDELFRILQEKGATTVTELMNFGSIKNLLTIARLAASPEVTGFFLKVLKNVDLSGKNLKQLRDEAGRAYEPFMGLEQEKQQAIEEVRK